MLKPENKKKLQGSLTYHVVSGKVMAADAVSLHSAETVNGQMFKISNKNGSLFVDDAKVVKTDIEATNGVIHVIDTVIMPKCLALLAIFQEFGIIPNSCSLFLIMYFPV